MITSIILTILFFALFDTLCAQNNLPILKTNKSKLSYWIGKEYQKDGWNISPQLNPDILTIQISKKTNVSFVSEKDSLGFVVIPGNTYDFIVLQNDSIIAKTQIIAEKPIQKANYSASYKKAHDKNIYVEIPEVYELVNILFAITSTGKANNQIIEKSIPYYSTVINYFEKYKNEKIVSIIDSLISQRLIYHCELKLDAYSLEFNKHDKIVKSKIYNITSRENSNTLEPYILLIQDFAYKTKYRQFYNENKALYQGQVSFYKDSIDVASMFKWLDENFPNTDCNSIKIVFSPLVSGWQNANTIQNNNFTEVFAHVNFPYYHSNNFSQQANILRRGNAIFTELNHNFLSSQYGKSDYSNKIDNAIRNLNNWVDTLKSARNYSNPRACFDEYMNWGLVSLWYKDKAPEEEQELLFENIESFMTNQRGFTKFREFNLFLIRIYQNRKPNETISDLYPTIINWFHEN